MAIPLSRVLLLPIFKQAQVLAGEKGINRMVDCVTLIESFDGIKWLTKNDLVISNAHFLLNEKSHSIIIPQLLKMGAAGIAIKQKRFMNTIPEVMINDAVKLNFPIISLPYSVTPTQIIKSVTFEVMRSDVYDTRYSYEENFLKELIFAETERNTLINRALIMGWNIDTKLGLILIKIDPHSFTEQIFSLCKRSCPYTCYTFVIKDYIVVITVDQVEDSKGFLSDYAQMLESNIKEDFGDIKFSIGIGRCYDEIIHLNKSFHEAKIAIDLGLTFQKQRIVNHFGDLGIYGVIFDTQNKEAVDIFFDQTIRKIIKYDQINGTDYLKTIEIFLNHRGSIRDTAKELFVHYNTVRYRLGKIKSILGLNLDDADIMLNLQVGIKMAKINEV